MCRAPNTDPWSTDNFNDLEIRVGYNQAVIGNSFSWRTDQSTGAALYAMTLEILVIGPIPNPPPGCGGWIDLSRIRTRAFALGDIEDDS
jgi:hypothetical protein